MTRRAVLFDCEGDALVGSLDEGPATTGLLIVSGGNEIRSGAFSGQAALAAKIAAEGFPVFRFDRRGTGDSEGRNRGFRGSHEDIAAAIAAFREQSPQLELVVAFGNCDAASALALMGGEGCDALVLSNPWTFDDDADDSEMPATAIRARYLEKLRNPAEIVRLLTGKVDLRKLLSGLKSASAPKAAPSSLANELAQALDQTSVPFTILIAGNDRTGKAFEASWNGGNALLQHCKGASHAYAEPHASEWLEARILEALKA